MMVSVRWVAPVLLLVVAMPALAARSSHPPRELHRVGDHWTPYNPPDVSTYPPNAKTHTIKGGDTLWALAQQYYGNAYLWPQLWEANTWITDAHWIYPGDVLLVQGEGGTGTTTTTGTGLAGGNVREGEGEETAPTAEISPNVGPPVPLGTDVDVYCYGYIGDPNEPMPNFIESFEDTEIMHQVDQVQTASASTGDLLFVNGGTATGIIAGETYMIVQPGDLIKNPRTGEVLGRHYNYQGQLKVLCAEENRARGIISESCREINAGDRLKPLPQIPIPLARIPDLPAFCDAPSGKRTGVIVDANDWDLAVAEGNLVQINLGREDQIQPGDFLTVFRESPVRGQPRQVVGEIGILTTENHTATAKVVLSRRAMYIGDLVELR